MALKRESLIPLLCFGISLITGLLLTGCGAHVYHQVRKDETLYSISWRYNQDFQQIAKWNGLSPPYTIKQGQWLRVAPPAPDAGLEPPVYAKSPRTARSNKDNKNSDIGPSSQVAIARPSAGSGSSGQISSGPISWIWPVKGKVIQTFAADTPGKQGIDIAASEGTIVNASAAGKVVYSGNGLRGYGNLIIIKHDEKFLSAYAHNQSILVKEGALGFITPTCSWEG